MPPSVALYLTCSCLVNKHLLRVGWRTFRTGVSCFFLTLFYFILLALTHRRVTCCWHPEEFGSPFSVVGLSIEEAIVHTPCQLRITITTNRQVPKWFCSRGRCTHWVINFCGAHSSSVSNATCTLQLIETMSDEQGIIKLTIIIERKMFPILLC